MAKPTGNKSAPPPAKPSGNRLLTGLLVGMLIGVGLAAALAWYVMKSPSPFTQKTQLDSKPPAAEQSASAIPPTTQSPNTVTTAPAAEAGGKPRFEFYNVLTNKQDTAPAVRPESPSKSSKTTPENKEVVGAQVLQVAALQNMDDAEKLKAKLAILGVEANIQTAAIPDKGVWYRVRLGPYKNAEELARTQSFLKQNGVSSTPMRAR
jgi:cell division protein FtsN